MKFFPLRPAHVVFTSECMLCSWRSPLFPKKARSAFFLLLRRHSTKASRSSPPHLPPSRFGIKFSQTCFSKRRSGRRKKLHPRDVSCRLLLVFIVKTFVIVLAAACGAPNGEERGGRLFNLLARKWVSPTIIGGNFPRCRGDEDLKSINYAEKRSRFDLGFVFTVKHPLEAKKERQDDSCDGRQGRVM